MYCRLKTKQPMLVTGVSHCFYIQADFHWRFVCHGRQVLPAKCPLLSTLPSTLQSVTGLEQALTLLDGAKICEGNTDEKFHDLSKARKGCFMGATGVFLKMLVFLLLQQGIILNAMLFDLAYCFLFEQVMISWQQKSPTHSAIQQFDTWSVRCCSIRL